MKKKNFEILKLNLSASSATAASSSAPSSAASPPSAPTQSSSLFASLKQKYVYSNPNYDPLTNTLLLGNNHASNGAKAVAPGTANMRPRSSSSNSTTPIRNHYQTKKATTSSISPFPRFRSASASLSNSDSSSDDDDNDTDQKDGKQNQQQRSPALVAVSSSLNSQSSVDFAQQMAKNSKKLPVSATGTDDKADSSSSSSSDTSDSERHLQQQQQQEEEEEDETPSIEKTFVKPIPHEQLLTQDMKKNLQMIEMIGKPQQQSAPIATAKFHQKQQKNKRRSSSVPLAPILKRPPPKTAGTVSSPLLNTSNISSISSSSSTNDGFGKLPMLPMQPEEFHTESDDSEEALFSTYSITANSLNSNNNNNNGDDPTPDPPVVLSFAQSKHRVMYSEWLASYAREQSSFASSALCARIVLAQLFASTANLPSPNPLRTAVCCMVLEKICSLFSRYEEVLKPVRRELYSSLFIDFQKYYPSPLSSSNNNNNNNEIFEQLGNFNSEDLCRQFIHFNSYFEFHDQVTHKFHLFERQFKKMNSTVQKQTFVLDVAVRAWQANWRRSVFLAWRGFVRTRRARNKRLSTRFRKFNDAVNDQLLRACIQRWQFHIIQDKSDVFSQKASEEIKGVTDAFKKMKMENTRFQMQVDELKRENETLKETNENALLPKEIEISELKDKLAKANEEIARLKKALKEAEEERMIAASNPIKED